MSITGETRCMMSEVTHRRTLLSIKAARVCHCSRDFPPNCHELRQGCGLQRAAAVTAGTSSLPAPNPPLTFLHLASPIPTRLCSQVPLRIHRPPLSTTPESLSSHLPISNQIPTSALSRCFPLSTLDIVPFAKTLTSETIPIAQYPVHSRQSKRKEVKNHLASAKDESTLWWQRLQDVLLQQALQVRAALSSWIQLIVCKVAC